MNYKVIIHEDRPFKKTISLFGGFSKFICKSQTIEVLFLNDDGGIDKTIEYGYVTKDEIKQTIHNKEDIDLDGCYVNDLKIENLEVNNIFARYAFLDNTTVINRMNILYETDFTSSIFAGDSSFTSSRFNGITLFMSSIFCGITTFSSSNFYNITYFDNSEFMAVTSLKHLTMSTVTFSNAKFKSNMQFEWSIFNNSVSFDNAIFDASALFENLTFNNNASFERAYFGFLTRFEQISILGDVNFNSVEVIYLSFEKSRFSSNVYLDFKKCDCLSLIDSIFEKSCEFGMNNSFNEFCLKRCMNFGQMSLDFERQNLKSAIYKYAKKYKDISPYDLAYGFNLLKINFNKIGRYNDEDKAYVEYRRCMRRSLDQFLPNPDRKFSILKLIFLTIIHPLRKFLNWLLLDLISCYCTKPFRVLLSVLIAIIFFGIMFFVTGTVEFSGNYQGIAGCLYHSIITFFTIGYGDSNPSETFGLLLTGLEGFAGVFLMSLFTVSFVRKALR